MTDNKKCTDCVHLSEDLAGGTGQLFCSCGDIGWDASDEFDPSTSAQKCNFFLAYWTLTTDD